MKNENELDDFLRSKEEGFNIPFEEKYWDKASAFIEAERGRRVIGWNVRNMILVGGAIILLMGGVSYLVLNTSSSHKTELVNSTTVNSSTTNSTVNNNTSTTNTTSATAATINSTTANAATTNAGSNNSETNNAAIAGVNSNEHNVNAGTVASNTKSTATSNAKKTSALTAKTVKSIAKSNTTNNVTANNNVTSVNTTANSSTSENARQTTDNAGIQQSDIPSLTDLTAPKPMYFNNPVESTIPVFANMSVYDNAMSTLYGLPYKSDGNAAATKIREFKNGTQYPQLGIALTGGLNIFNSFKDNEHTYSYAAANPFLGVKGSYQWNEKWFAQAQLNVLQRGGVNEDIPAGDIKGVEINPASQVYAVKNLYYVQLPVMIGYQISKKNSITAGLGIDYLLADGAQVRDTTSGKYLGSYKLEEDKGFNKLDCFVTAGYTYRMNRRFSVSLTASYGLTNVTDNSYFDQTGSRHNMNLGLALNYSLLQKKIFAR